MLDVGIVDMDAAAIVVGNGVCTAVVGTTVAPGMVYCHTGVVACTVGCIAGCSTGLPVLVVVAPASVVTVVVVAGTVVLTAPQLSTSLILSPIHTPFVANVTSAAFHTSGCVRTAGFYTRRSTIVCLHVGICYYTVLVESS